MEKETKADFIEDKCPRSGGTGADPDQSRDAWSTIQFQANPDFKSVPTSVCNVGGAVECQRASRLALNLLCTGSGK